MSFTRIKLVKIRGKKKKKSEACHDHKSQSVELRTGIKYCVGLDKTLSNILQMLQSSSTTKGAYA